MSSSTTAVSVKNVIKTYGTKVVLDGLCTEVERGIIYGLLGSSGCGKTTLLSCIVGRKGINAGDIRILGGRPGEKGSGVPGPKVGYMPQELALIEEFTIKDTIYYFGTIFRMNPIDIDERLEYLSILLELPPSNTFLKHCSGGQKRRVSFAVALIHSPELLILDEPTVGVDPILREKLWNHLVHLVEKNRTTVIITTHYIEEAKDAHKVSLMRKGKILIEESPKKLLSAFNKNTLEEVFLLLSNKQDKQRVDKDNNRLSEASLETISTISASTSVESFVMGYGSRDELTKSSEARKSKKDKSVYMSATDIDKCRLKALLNKNWKQFYRNVGGCIFFLTFPFIQMWFFNNSIGSDPRDLKLGIVNNETMTALCTDFDWNETAVYADYECHFRNLTCRFLTYLEHPMINKILYNSFQEAVEGIKHGDILGILYIPTNFSETYEERISAGSNAGSWVTDYGEIKAYMDMSNKLTGAALAAKLHNLFIQFQDKLFTDCHLPEKLAHIPIQQTFLYGDNEKPTSIFVTPGMVLMLIYLLSTTMTSTIIVKEKFDGIWDRSIIAGVSSIEITLSHLSLQSVILLIECAEVMLMVHLVPQIEITGSSWILFLLIYLQGVCGMAFGFMVSAMGRGYTDTGIICTGGYLPMTLISGVIWPIEAMPTALKWLSLATPCTVPILSFRNVMSKGWGLWNPEVINGVVIMLGWIFVFGIASVWFIKIKR